MATLSASHTLTNAQLVYIQQQGFSGTPKRIVGDDQYRGWWDIQHKDAEKEHVLEIIRELKNARTREDLPDLDIMAADNSKATICIPPIEKHYKSVADTVPYVSSLPIVIPSHLLSKEIGLSPEEAAAVIAHAINEHYVQLKPIRAKDIALGGAAAGVLVGSYSAARLLENDTHPFTRRAFLGAAGGAVLGSGVGYVAGSKMQQDSEAFYAQPIIAEKEQDYTSAMEKIALWQQVQQASPAKG